MPSQKCDHDDSDKEIISSTGETQTIASSGSEGGIRRLDGGESAPGFSRFGALLPLTQELLLQVARNDITTDEKDVAAAKKEVAAVAGYVAATGK